MIPGDDEVVRDGDMPIRVDVMPSVVFEQLWSGLTSSEELFGPDAEIEVARNWLNYTMQGLKEENDDG